MESCFTINLGVLSSVLYGQRSLDVTVRGLRDVAMTSTNEGLTLCPCPAGRCDPESTTLNAQGSQLCDQEVDDGFLHLPVSVKIGRAHV